MGLTASSIRGLTSPPLSNSEAGLMSAYARCPDRSEEHTLNSSHLGISYSGFCLKKKSLATPWRGDHDVRALPSTLRQGDGCARVLGWSCLCHVSSVFFFFKSWGPPIIFPFSPKELFPA